MQSLARNLQRMPLPSPQRQAWSPRAPPFTAAGAPTPLPARARARTTIEDFASTYFPLHGLSLPKDLFRFLDVLVWVEATIYQVRGCIRG